MNKITFDKLDKMDFRSNEAYKILRTNILFSGSKIKAIGLTSCIPGEGKTSVSINLARAFADIGKKVVFINADMRKSVMAGRYHIKNIENGLSHYLSGQCLYEECLCETNIENLYFVDAGPVPPNPAELLGSEQFAELMVNCRRDFDYIIIDTPPLGSVIDSAIVAKQLDGVALVMENNKISYKFAQKVKEQLEQSNCRILGVIINKVESGKKGYYGKYYGKYYGRYYGVYNNGDED